MDIHIFTLVKNLLYDGHMCLAAVVLWYIYRVSRQT